jgi:hypothetical protein
MGNDNLGNNDTSRRSHVQLRGQGMQPFVDVEVVSSQEAAPTVRGGLLALKQKLIG